MYAPWPSPGLFPLQTSLIRPLTVALLGVLNSTVP